jgi:hypothetical protein
VGINEGTNQQVIPYMLDGIAIGKRQKLRGKTIGHRRYKVEKRFIKGCRW